MSGSPFDVAMRFWMIVLMVPLSLMTSPKYLAVVAFVPPVCLPSALDRFAATTVPVPINTGTTTSLESSNSRPIAASARSRGLVFSDLFFFFNTEQCLLSSCCSFSFIVSPAMAGRSICRCTVLFGVVCVVSSPSQCRRSTVSLSCTWPCTV